MSYPVPTTFSDHQTVGVAAVVFDTVLEDGQYYVFSASTATYIMQGSAPTASASDGSTFVPANITVLIDGMLGKKLSVIRQSADGVATLTRVKFVR